MVDTQTNQVVGSPITVGTGQYEIAITPDGKSAYVVNLGGGNVSVVDTQTNQVVGSPIEVGAYPSAIAITPNGKSAYVVNFGSANVSVIDTQTNQVVGPPISVGSFPRGIAISPDQSPVTVAYPGVRVKCPPSAKHGGCRFKLQAVTKKRKGKAESAVASAKLRAGHSALVALKPKPAYEAKLAAAKNALIKETVRMNGSKRTLVKKLKIVQ